MVKKRETLSMFSSTRGLGDGLHYFGNVLFFSFLKRIVALGVVALLLYATPMASVDSSKFMTCQDSASCRRYRTFVDFQEKYRDLFETPLFEVKPETVDPPNAQRNGNVGSAVLRNTVNNSELSVRLLLTSGGVIRVTLDELVNSTTSPLYTRYKVVPDDVLMDTALHNAAQTFFDITTWLDTAANGVTSLHMKIPGPGKNFETLLTLQYSPFKLLLYVNGQLAQAVNERQIMNFERYRERPISTTDAPTPSPGDQVLPSTVPTSASGASEPQLEPIIPASNVTMSVDAINGNTTASSTVQQPKPVCDAVELDSSDAWESFFGGGTDRKAHGPSAGGIDVDFVSAAHVYGLPEHAVSFDLPVNGSEPYRSWNLDVFEYALDSPMALYGSVPFLLSIHRPSLIGNVNATFATGFLWVNPSETFINLQRIKNSSTVNEFYTTRTWFLSETGVLDFLMFVGPSPQNVVSQYHLATGLPALAPLFSVGKHQCRWNYVDEKDVASVNANFDAHQIPYDVLWLDIDHTNQRRYFTWHPEHFADPVAMLDRLARNARKLVAIVDPHIKKDAKYPVYSTLKKERALLQQVNPNSKGLEDFEAWCWPGDSVYPDFLSAKVRTLFQMFYHPAVWRGSGDTLHVWNDMNEPSVFNKPEITCPRDVVHLDGREHREVHNLYGMYFHRTTFEGLLQRNPNRRPFILTRSFFIGSHRYGAVWTGDNSAEWDHLKIAIPMLLSLAVSGLSFVGADVGGFFGNPNPELYTRWSQQGAWYPFYRDHSHIDSKRREPWLFDASVLQRVREAVELRYALLPYWYTAFAEYAHFGLPIIKPLWWWSEERPPLSDVYGEPMTSKAQEDHFKIGDHLLVRSITDTIDELESRSAQLYPGLETPLIPVFLPRSGSPSSLWHWFDLHTGCPVIQTTAMIATKATLDRIPVYAEAGSIIPIKSRVRRSSTLQLGDPFTLHVYLSVRPLKQQNQFSVEARGKAFVDDGQSYAFAKHLAFAYDTFNVSGSTHDGIRLSGAPQPLHIDPTLKRSIETLEHENVDLTVEKLVFFGVPLKPTSVTVTKGHETVRCEFYVDPLECNDSPTSLFKLQVKQPAGVKIGLHDWSLRITF